MVNGRGRRVDVDDFQFLIADFSGGEVTADTSGVELLSYDIEIPDWVIVHTGAHWGPASVRSEVHAVPPAVEAEWEEVVEVSVRCETGLVVVELGGDPILTICEQGGQYRLRMSTRGRAAGAERYSSEAGSKILEHYLIQVWAADPDPPLTMREAPSAPAYVRPAHVYEEAGIAAVRRLHRALDDSPPLSGQRVTVRTERPISGTRRRLYGAFRDPSGWLTSSSGSNSDGFGMSGDVDHDYFGEVNRIVPCNGTIDCRFLEGKSPAYSLCSWSWYRSAYGGHLSGLAVPATPQMTLRFDLTQVIGEDGKPVTTVRVEHAHVPAEWAEDLTAYWQWMLERADLDFDLRGKT
jgi:hypothetical protein